MKRLVVVLLVLLLVFPTFGFTSSRSPVYNRGTTYWMARAIRAESRARTAEAEVARLEEELTTGRTADGQYIAYLEALVIQLGGTLEAY